MAISSVTGWIDKDNRRYMYIRGESAGYIPMPPDASDDYKKLAMKTLLDNTLDNRDWVNWKVSDFIELGIMMGNRLEKVPNGN